MAGQNIWDQTQYAFQPPLQLEELPYPFDTTSAKRLPQQRQFHPPMQNAPVTPNRFGSFSSAGSFGTASGFARQPTLMRPSAFNPHDIDVNLALDTSSSSFGASPHAPHISPVYSQPNLNPSPVNYQAGQFSPTLEVNHTPEGSPNHNVAMPNHSMPHHYLPTGPMQFSPPLPLPARQSELQSHYFNATYMRMQQDPFPTSKRHKPSDDYDDGHGDQPDGHEQEIARPKPLVDPT